MQALEHKIPPPLVCLIIAAAMWAAAQRTPVIQMDDTLRFIITAALALCGLLFVAPALIAFGRAKTTMNPLNIEAASALVTSGIYAYTRNPMYVGLTALLCSWAVFLAAPWVALGPVAFMIFITRFQIIPEERVMHSKFGPDFDAYRQRTRRWL